jgi:hypothetical protein
MNPQHALALVLSCIAAPAVASDDSLQALAHHSGLTEHKVAIVLGQPMSQLDQRYVYKEAKHRLERAIGRDTVRQLQGGETVAIRLPTEGQVGEVIPIAAR